MEKIGMILIDSTLDVLNAFAYFVKNNLKTFANLMDFIVPYAMYAIGQYIFSLKGFFSIGVEVIIPIVFVVITYYLRAAANKLGKGSTVPIPKERFTSVDDDGEVSIENDRLQELLLYVSDVEDWLERKDLV